MTVEELETPCLVVDLEVMEENLARMADYCSRHGLLLRPHVKTHKSPWLARKQVEMGATGITVAKVGEAEVMAQAGLADLLIAYPILGESKARRLAKVAVDNQVTVSLDSREAADWASRAADGNRIRILVEVDFGMRRCGLPPGELPVELARYADSLPGLQFAGLLLYSGHLHPDLEESPRKVERLAAELEQQLRIFRREGIEVPQVSGGSTPSAYHSHLIEGLTEIRPGTYIFNDRNTVHWGTCSAAQCAATVWVTVVSNAVPGQAIIDGGSKTFSSDPLGPAPSTGFGIVAGHPDVEFFRMNEEHGYLRLPGGIKLKVGERLQIIPNHVCTTMNMHERVWGARGGQVEKEWEIEARGKIR